MATVLSENNNITVGDLEVQRIPCLSVSLCLTSAYQLNAIKP